MKTRTIMLVLMLPVMLSSGCAINLGHMILAKRCNEDPHFRATHQEYCNEHAPQVPAASPVTAPVEVK